MPFKFFLQTQPLDKIVCYMQLLLEFVVYGALIKTILYQPQQKITNTVENYIHITYLDFSLPHEPRNIAATCWMFLIHLLLNEYMLLVHANSIFQGPLHIIHKTNHLFTLCNSQSHNKIIIWLNAWASFSIYIYITSINSLRKKHYPRHYYDAHGLS